MPRVARGLYSRPRERFDQPEGGLDIRELVQEAKHVNVFERLFNQAPDVADLIQSAAQRRGWALPRAEILEAMEEFA